MKIALIGVGNLGLSIAKGLVDQTNFDVEQLVLTKRNVSNLDGWKKHPHVLVTPSNIDAVRASDIIILCVQPSQINTILNEIKDELDEKRHLLISTITGRKIQDIADVIGKKVAIIRSMPNTAISVRESMTCLSTNANGKAKIGLAEEIFNAMGETMVIDENKMQAATVVCASGIAFWMRLIRATTQGAIQLGFDAPDAKEMATQACLGAATLLLESGNHPEEEIDRVTTPMGCTISGLNEMEHEGMSSALIKGLMKSYEKISQIMIEK
ncbi:pyrroline-5-carboxylate reductase [Reichenbachiella agarivorans]|uniref:Pyrroline-5-carboxylate reductase n=1 Tax=Reichenbachiella agarivorans TaxID=2979464 RepID=A0ABY6CPE6_9BACT|nr:pyrroline-5-carboxylate reductase [Reichenbachiella agarivorans]UXP31328.1 pyrroline-5-carboxylate reductase [Reichenbachiella agarivorans]